MLNPQKAGLEPYTSVALSSVKEANGLFEELLSSKAALGPRKADKPVVLYGAGSLGKMAKNFFNRLNIPVLRVVDKNAAQCSLDKNWAGVEVISPDEAAEADKADCLLVICIVTSPQIALRDELRAAGWQDTAFFYDVCETYRDRHPLGNGWFLGNLGSSEISAVKKVFSALDDVSRLHYLQFLAWRKLRVEILSENIRIDLDNRFFIPEITDVLTETEVFVDCGAHHGSVTEKFIETVRGRYKAVYAIEPDHESLMALEARLKNAGNITVRQVALSDRSGKGNFYQGFDFASKLDKNGGAEVDVATLDSLNIPATFLKLHLEGGELDALKGAAATMRSHRPVIAVTGYHNPDGAWKLPLFLIESLENYRYCMRVHSWAGTGAVFYAIPAERRKKG